MTLIKHLHGYSPDVAKVWRLEPDGTPIDFRWDRKLRIDGEQTYASKSLWLRLADGERELWPWIVEHLRRGNHDASQSLDDAARSPGALVPDPTGVGSYALNSKHGLASSPPLVFPIAVEMWSQRPDRDDFIHWTLPRVHPVDPISKHVDEGGWPVVGWRTVENVNWPCPMLDDEPRAMWFEVVDGRPSEAPPPLTREEAAFA